jgi:uncharacterized membrane protein
MLMALDRTRIGRVFFALALVGLGVEHFIFRDFITGRAPAWPAAVPGGVIWAWFTGAIFIGAATAVIAGKNARAAAVLAAALIAFWALLRHMPIVATDAFLSGAWTRAGKALTFVGGALAIAATFPALRTPRDIPLLRLVNLDDELVTLGRYCLGLFLIITGIQHFMFTAFVASLIPAWFPGNAIFWTYFAGVALIVGGVGVMIRRTARLAALLSGLMVFSWFWIVHIPRTFVGVSDSIAVFEALAVSGVALVLSGQTGRVRG